MSTRDALLREALRLIGEHGFAGASTRDIADAAGANVASVAYYFDSKSGLYRACGIAIAQMLASATLPPPAPAGSADTTDAAGELASLFRRLAYFLFKGEQSSLVVPFLLREIADPGEAFEEIYERLLEPLHGRLCALWCDAAGGEPESEAIKITVFSMLGQLLYFRVASKAVARRLGKAALGDAEINSVCNTIETNIRARIAHDRSLKP